MPTLATREAARRVERPIVEQADSFVLVSLWLAKSGNSEDYETHATLNDALDAYVELERGEYPRARPVGIFRAHNGMPSGETIKPHAILRLVRESRAA